VPFVGYPASPGSGGGSPAGRGWTGGWPDCHPADMVLRELPEDTGGARFWLHPAVADLFEVWMTYCSRRFNYEIRPEVSGGYNCRAISGTSIPSTHSYGLAPDINWDENPMGQSVKTDIPKGMVSVGWAYRIYWGGWFAGNPDPMHFEYAGTPEQAVADTARIKRELGGTMSAESEALTFNTASIVSNMAQMKTSAQQRDWQEPGVGGAAPSMALPLVTVIDRIDDNVKTLVAEGLPVQITLDAATQASLATQIADSLAARYNLTFVPKP
jgi:hypothetical protein